mmetsp:Transcript_15218/g.29927  ORF Transcript_15218/g.29927 Transcript_15218/m.29927 type:complete len:364 (+) Transcript_15218:32-1123(+)
MGKVVSKFVHTPFADLIPWDSWLKVSMVIAALLIDASRFKSFLRTCLLSYMSWRVYKYFFLKWPSPPKGAAVFVTGCDTGIGRSTALYLQKLGFHVFAGVLCEKAGSALAKEATVAAEGDSTRAGQISPVVCDVTKDDDIAAAADLIASKTGGKLWGLVNNAGVKMDDGPVEFIPEGRARITMEVNFWGLWKVTKKMLPLVRAAKGRVVNISSVNGFFSWPWHTTYCASKHACLALSDCLRSEVHRLGVHVVSIHPGGVKTEIWRSAPKVCAASWEECGEECWKVYGKRTEAYVLEHSAKAQKIADDPVVVSRAIHHALSSQHPEHKYVIGSGSGFLSLFQNYFPDVWRRALQERLFRGEFQG